MSRLPSLGLLLVALCAGDVAAAAATVFSTTDTFEVDKCASIWLIRRFVDRDAVIKVFPSTAAIDTGTPFDTPTAFFRRYATRSTFETLVEHHRISDPRVRRLALIVHDIEINTWEEKRFPRSREVEEAVQVILERRKGDSAGIIEDVLRYFDALVGSLDGATPAGSPADDPRPAGVPAEPPTRR